MKFFLIRVMCFDLLKDLNKECDKLEILEKVKYLEKYAKAFPEN